MPVTLDQIWPFAVGLAIVVGIAALLLRLAQSNAKRIRRAQGDTKARMEALFRASFPELQPHFHPRNVHAYARARQSRKASSGPFKWRNPPGFELAAVAEVELDGSRDRVRLLDAQGAVLASFVFEEHPEGAALRVGKGKFTVGLKGPEPRVRYWHPEREFKWTPTRWQLKSGVSDHELQSSSRDDSWSESSSSHSSSGSATAAAAGAGIVAAGGTFDGGGASAAWDSGGGASSDSSGSSPDFSSVESGSSTSSSTTY